MNAAQRKHAMSLIARYNRKLEATYKAEGLSYRPEVDGIVLAHESWADGGIALSAENGCSGLDYYEEFGRSGFITFVEENSSTLYVEWINAGVAALYPIG